MAKDEGGGDGTTNAVKTRALSSTRATQPQLSQYGDIATIEVGNKDNKRIFRLHREFMSFYSGYFRAALEGTRAESKSGTIKLETEDPLVFERSAHWLYTNNITDDTRKASSSIIISLWLFADRRSIPLLMKDMTNALQLDIVDRWSVPTDKLHNIYENTTDESALRRMMAWSLSRLIDASIFRSHVERWPQEACVDVLRLVLTDRPTSTLSKDQYQKVNMCPTYHFHEDDASCRDKMETG